MMKNDEVSRYAKGILGETVAANYLESLGMVVKARRFRAGKGEIDLILLSETCLVFAEIKLREHIPAESAVYAVTKEKQRRMMDTASCYLGQHPEYVELPCRFDVVTITKEGIRHYPNAFEWSTSS